MSADRCSEDAVRFERDGGVAVVTFDRPDKLNALTPPMVARLGQILDTVDQDRSVRVLVLTGAGGRAFSVGFDLDGLDMPDRTDDVTAATEANFRTLMRIWNLRVPVLTAVDGYAVAAGANLALLADVVVASTRATFAEPEIRHYALSPLLLLPWFANNPKRVSYLYFTGDAFGAEEARELGLVTSVVEPDRLLDEAMRMAHRIALAPPFAVESVKESLRRTYEAQGFTAAQQQHRLLDTLLLGAHGIPDRDRFFALMAEGDMRAFLEARDGPFRTQS